MQEYMTLSPNQNIEGHYNPEGANKFSEKHPTVFMKNWMSNKQFKISNIGVGTYTGSLD